MAEITLTQADNGKTIRIKPGTAVAIRLEENATTGYRWAVDQANPKQLTLSASTPEVTSTAMGGGGNRVFEFKAGEPGTAPLKLKLWREWQGDSSVIERFDVTLQVED